MRCGGRGQLLDKPSDGLNGQVTLFGDGSVFKFCSVDLAIHPSECKSAELSEVS